MSGAINGNWGLQPVGGDTAVARGWREVHDRTASGDAGCLLFHYRYNGITSAVNAGMGARVSEGLDVGAVYSLGPGRPYRRVCLGPEQPEWLSLPDRRLRGDDRGLLDHTGAFADNTVTAQVFTMGMSIRF